MFRRTLVVSLFVLGAAVSAGAADDALVFEPARVLAPVAAGGSGVWVVSSGTSTTTEIGEDTDEDGRIELARAADASTSVWFIDMQSGRMLSGTSAGPVPAPFAFPAGLFVEEPAQQLKHVVYQRPGPAQFVWVRPGYGAWQVVRRDGDTFDRDGLLNGYAVFPVADFAALPRSPYTTPSLGVAAGDVFLGIESAATWFGGEVDDHLGNSNGAGVIGPIATAGSVEGFNLGFFVYRRGGTNGTVSVKYTTEDGTALAGVDYDATSGTLVFAPGEDIKQVKVQLKGNNTYGGYRKFVVRFSEPSGTTMLRTATEVSVSDDELPPRAAFADTVLAEGNAPIATASLDIVLTVPDQRAVPVIADWVVDAPGLPSQLGTVTFATDETRKTITVQHRGNARPNLDQLLEAELVKTVNAEGAGPNKLIRVSDDDFAELEVGDVAVSESSSVVTVPLRATITGKYIHGRYTMTGGNATAGSEYTAATGNFTIQANGLFAYIDVPLTDDSAAEPDEWFTVVLSEVTGATVVKGTGVVTIVDDESGTNRTPSIVVDDWAGIESDTAQFTVRLSSAAPEAVTMTATIRGGTAEPSRDYVDGSRTIIIPAGSTVATFPVDLVNDAGREQREQFEIELANASNATLVRAVATGRIEDDDDPALPLLTMHGHAAAEGDDRYSHLVTLRLSEPQPMDVTASYATADDTAKAGTDYVAESRQVIFEPGQTEILLWLAVVDDSAAETTETFRVRLTAATGATIATPSATCTILNDDSSGTPSKRRRTVRP